MRYFQLSQIISQEFFPHITEYSRVPTVIGKSIKTVFFEGHWKNMELIILVMEV